jgi:hypothetical protein
MFFGAGYDSDGFHFIGYAETQTVVNSPSDLQSWTVIKDFDHPGAPPSSTKASAAILLGGQHRRRCGKGRICDRYDPMVVAPARSVSPWSA